MDFLFEQGPRSCRTKGAGQETLALIEALGLQDQIVVPHSDAQNRYLYDGQPSMPSQTCMGSSLQSSNPRLVKNSLARLVDAQASRRR